MIVTILFRRGSAGEWTLANSVLRDGEPGYETDTGLFKIGDGVRAWRSLPYANASDAVAAVASVNQRVNDLTTHVDAEDLSLSNAIATLTESTNNSFADLSVFQLTTEDTLSFLSMGKQDADSNLTAIVGLSPSDDDILQRKAGSWVNRSIAQLKTDLVLTKSDVGLDQADNTSDANKPISTATAAALAGKEPTITATDSSQYYRGDKTMQPLNKAAVGLSNVDNTSDANKPISTAQQTALDARLDRTEIVSQTSIPQRINLVQNPICAISKGSYGWSPSRVTVTNQSGYLRLTINDATASDMSQRLNSKNTTFQFIEPSVLRQFQAKVRSNTGLPFKMTVVFYNSVGTSISSVSSSTVTPDNTSFSLLSVQITTPSTAAYAYLQVGISGTGARSIGQWFDIKEIFAGDPGTYFDGSTGSVDGALTRWTGVPGDSVSYASIVPAPVRLTSGSSTTVPSSQGVVDVLSGVRIGEERVPITRFGALGDGVNDDTSAILDAIRKTRPTRDTPTAGVSGFFLTVPPGEYLLSDTILFYRWSGIFEGVGVGNGPLYVSPGNASVFRWIGPNDRPMFKNKDSRHLTYRRMRFESNDVTPPTYIIENNNLTADSQGHNSNLTFEDLYFGSWTWSSQGTDKGGGIGAIGWTGDDGNNDQWYVNRCFFRSFSGQALYLPNVQSIWGSVRDTTFWGCGVGIKTNTALSGYNVAFQGCGKDVEVNGSNDKPIHISDWFSEHSGQICHVTDRGRVFVSGGLWTLHSEMTSNPMLRHDNAINQSGFNIDGVYINTALATHPKIKMTATNVATKPGRLSIRETQFLVDLTTGFDLTTSASSGLDVNLQFGDYNITGLRLTTGTISSVQPDPIAAFNAALV